MRGEELVNAFVALGAERDEFERKLKLAEAVNEHLREEAKAKATAQSSTANSTSMPHFELGNLESAQRQTIESWTTQRAVFKSWLDHRFGSRGRKPTALREILSKLEGFLISDFTRLATFSQTNDLLKEALENAQELMQYRVGMHNLLRLARTELHLPVLTPPVTPSYAADGEAIAEILHTWRAMRETAQQRLDELNVVKREYQVFSEKMTKDNDATIQAKSLLENDHFQLKMEARSLRRLVRCYLDQIIAPP